MEFPNLTHPNCRNIDCGVCFKDHTKLQKKLEELTGDNKAYDHLGKYHKWLSDNGINPETEWGWATPESFEEENILAYVKWFKKEYRE